MRKNTAAVLINPPVPQLNDDKMQPPGGLISIATFCQLHGYDVRVVDLAGKGNEIDMTRFIPESDVYGISLYTVTYNSSVELVAALRKRNPSSFFVAGGPHASALPNHVIGDFDCVVCGEGEYAFLSVLDSLEGGTPCKIPIIIRAAPIEDLNKLPFPDFYRHSDMKCYNRQILGMPAISLDSSRGCDNQCRFCNSRVVERGRWRTRSPESITNEIQWHMANGYQAFRFNDDNFLNDPQRTLQLCKLLVPLGIKYRIFARAESLTEQICDALSISGCVHIGVGVESMSDTMLTLMGKATRAADMQRGIRAAHRAGIKTRGFFICGFPGETDKTVRESINGISTLCLDEAIIYPCIPYPGTDLFTSPEKFGITWIDPDFSKYLQIGSNRRSGFVMETDKFKREDVANWRDLYMEAFRQQNIDWSDEGGYVK